MSVSPRARAVLRPLAVAAAAAILAGAAERLPLTRRLLEPAELTTLDWRVRSNARSEPDPWVALVLLDSASVAEWPYLSPFPRSVLASLVELAARAGARAVVLDVYLDRRFPGLDALDGGEARLRRALEQARNVVLVARTERVGDRRVLLPPHPYFSAPAAAVATADLPTPYETVRDATLLVRTPAGPVPGAPLAAYALARGLPLDSMLAGAARTGALTLPILPPALASLRPRADVLHVPLTFRGPPSRPGEAGGAFPAYAASTLLQLGDALPAEWLRGRVVVIGTGYHPEDRFRSPFYEAVDSTGAMLGWTYGSEVMATAISNLLDGHYPRSLPRAALGGLLLVLGLGTSAATFAFGPAAGAAAAGALLLLWWITAWWAFAAGPVQLPLVLPTLAVAGALAGSAGYAARLERSQKHLIRRVFARYLAPSVVDELLRDPARLVLGGERREVTVLFSDLVGFTRLSERVPPERLVLLLSRYLDEMTRVVLEHRGTLDKFIGDGVMAMFGAPTALPDHAARACAAALAMQRRLRALNAGWSREGWPELRMRVGVHTGTPVVGNVGGEQRFDYTAMGDDVNVASRLESACREYGVEILVSEQTARAAGDAFLLRELDTIALYGRSGTLRIFELADPERASATGGAELRRLFQSGTDAYRRRDFPLALCLFREAERIRPDDPPTRLYIERVQKLLLAPPPADWEPVERRTTK